MIICCYREVVFWAVLYYRVKFASTVSPCRASESTIVPESNKLGFEYPGQAPNLPKRLCFSTIFKHLKGYNLISIKAL